MNLLRNRFSRRRPCAGRFRPACVELEPRVLLSADVLTWHNDNARTGQDLSETLLTPANVNANDFGKLYTDPVDGAVFAQPLYKSAVTVPGQGTLNLVFVATENDSVYAFNADSLGAPVWHDSFLNPAAGVTPVPSTDLGSGSLGTKVGITGTPVIDPSTNTLYVVAFTKEVTGGTTSYVQRLHALDLATGAEKFGGPVVIQASVAGSGQGGNGSVVTFNARTQNQRPGLLLDNGVVYIAWASFGDLTPYHGWVIGYNAQTLQQVSVFNTTPDGGLGGIWMSGAAPAADAAGNLYFLTGNGTFDGSADYGDSFVKLTPTANGLVVSSYFTPFDQSTLDANDADLGSGGATLVPGGEVIGAGKQGIVYVLNTNSLGGFHASGDQVTQEVSNAVNTTFATPAYFNGRVYYAGVSDALKAFALVNGLLSTSPVSKSSMTFPYPGATPSISANGTSNGIVWVVQNAGNAVLFAYDAANLATELYDSSQAGTRDQLDKAVTFEVPTIANGKVYVATQTGLSVFGELPTNGSAYGQAGMFVSQVYQDLLDRAPEAGGLAYWSGQINQGVITRTQFALAIERSTEYLTDQVSQVYSRFLHRPVDASGLSAWPAFLQAGGTLEQFEADVVGSPEYFQVRGGGTANGFLSVLYQDALGHAVDASGQASWGQALASGMSTGQVAAAVFASTEFKQDLVSGWYQQYLRRSADAAGLNAWVAALQQGTPDYQVIANFLGSAEYLAHV